MARTQTQQQVQPPARERVGQRIDTQLGAGTLFPGVGKLVQRSGEPRYCGAIVGQAFGYSESPNTRDPSRVSRRFAGDFLGIRQDGSILHTAEAYLPSSVERAVKAALDLRSGPISLAVDVWCEPDEQGRQTPLGYRYVCYDRKPRAEADPLMSLAYASGLLERPAPALPSPDEAVDYDPESGEIRE